MTNKAVLICAVLLTGCAPKPAPSPAPPSGPFRVTWQAQIAPRSLDVVPATATVTDAAGHPVAGAAVSVDLSMPSMSMPPNKTALRETRPGAYTGTVRYSMSGDWIAAVSVAENGQKTVQTFSITVK